MFGAGSSFILSGLSNLGLALYLVFKNNLFFSKLLQHWEGVAQSCPGLGHVDIQAPWPAQEQIPVVYCGDGLWTVLVAVQVVVNLSVQENWQGRRCNAACFLPCLLSLCWLESLPVRAWRSSFGSLLAFSAMETSQHRDWEGISALAGTGMAFRITSENLSLYHARWMINVFGMCSLGRPSRLAAQGNPLPKAPLYLQPLS